MIINSASVDKFSYFVLIVDEYFLI